jgi:hypothetical protein
MKAASVVCTGYTFSMKQLAWLIALGAVAGIVYSLWRLRKRWEERSRASEARMASFMAQSLPAGASAAAIAVVAAPAAPKPSEPLLQERLLLEAAAKAGEAGEAALSIQLYAKLLSRYPQTPLAAQARLAVEAQKKKLKL